MYKFHNFSLSKGTFKTNLTRRSLVERSLPQPHSPRITKEERGAMILPSPIVTSGQVINLPGPCLPALLNVSNPKNF